MKKIMLVVLALAFCLPAVAGDEIADHYLAAKKAEAARDFKTALAGYEKILDLNEDYKDAFELWEACVEFADWQEGLEGKPGPSDLVGLGVIYMKFERFDEERAVYREAITLDPGCTDAHGHLALSNYVSPGGSLITAIDETRKFLETSVHKEHLARAIRDFEIYGQLRVKKAKLADTMQAASLARKSEGGAKAAEILEQAVKGEMPDAYRTALLVSAAKMYFSVGDADGARRAFAAAIEHAACKHTIEARIGLAAIALFDDQPEEALVHLRAAVAEGSGAAKSIEEQRNRAFRVLFESEDAAVREEMEKLADLESGDEPIRKEIRQAVHRAKEEGKFVLLYWYGPYCPYVMAMEERLAHPAIRAELEAHYVLVRIDYGSHHRAMSLDAEYGGVFQTYGVPCFMTLDEEGELLEAKPDVDLMEVENRCFDVELILGWLTLTAEDLD